MPLLVRNWSSSHSTCIRAVIRFYSKQQYFNPNSATFWVSAKTPQQIPKSEGLPEVIVTGRANTGKSSLFNAVVGRKNLLETSKKAGRTQALKFYRVDDPGKLILVDAPGYGARGRVEWGKLFDEYIETREQLKRIYILFSAKHGLNAFDHQMLSHLSQKLLTERGTQPYTLQAIITKADLVPTKDLPSSISLIQKAIWESAPLCLPAIVTSTALSPPFQIDRVRKNILDLLFEHRVAHGVWQLEEHKRLKLCQFLETSFKMRIYFSIFRANQFEPKQRGLRKQELCRPDINLKEESY